jgi:hypothetical protein
MLPDKKSMKGTPLKRSSLFYWEKIDLTGDVLWTTKSGTNVGLSRFYVCKIKKSKFACGYLNFTAVP